MSSTSSDPAASGSSVIPFAAQQVADGKQTWENFVNVAAGNFQPSVQHFFRAVRDESHWFVDEVHTMTSSQMCMFWGAVEETIPVRFERFMCAVICPEKEWRNSAYIIRKKMMSASAHDVNLMMTRVLQNYDRMCHAKGEIFITFLAHLNSSNARHNLQVLRAVTNNERFLVRKRVGAFSEHVNKVFSNVCESQ